MGRLTKWDEANKCWIENHDNDTREWKNGNRGCMDKLAAYEDAEEQGLSVRLPCKVGQNCFIAIHSQNEICEITVSAIQYSIWHEIWTVSAANGATFFMGNAHSTREEAEAALAGKEQPDANGKI